MNIVQPVTATRQGFAGSSSAAPSAVRESRPTEFVVAALEADLTPYMLGALDAEKGELCVPEMYYIWEGDILAYVEGFEEVKGETLLSKQAKRIASRQVLSDAQIEAEAEDYEEAMLDEMFNRYGNWR